MKDKLHNVFKESPQRFGYAVDCALKEATQIKSKKRLSAPLRVVVATLLVFAILPSAVFGAVKICGAIAQKVGSFGVTFGISINEDAPKYVKMNVDVPKGFKVQENSGGQKFDRDTEEWEFGFTILPMRFYQSVDYTILERDVLEYKKMNISSRPVYELIATESYTGLKRYYVWYEEANVLILIYRGDTVTDKEFEDFVDCISFTEGTENDHDIFYEPEKDVNEAATDGVIYNYEQVFEELPLNTELVFAGYNEETGESELKVKSVITEVSVTDNISDLDESGINSIYKSDKLSNSSGKLLPKTVEIWQNGDGVETESKLISAESKEQKLVLIDIEYTNTTDKEVTLYIPHRLETFLKDEYENYRLAVEIDKAQDIWASEYCDSEIFYMSLHGDSEKDFYQLKLSPNETVTLTLGFRCVEDQLSNAYIVLNPTSDGVVTPDYSDSSDTKLIFKVQ